MNIIDIQKLIEQHMKDKQNIDVEQIEHFNVISTFSFPKNDYHTIEKYPIVDKGIMLIETEYYINKVGHRGIYAIEIGTNRFMDINQDTLELILKTKNVMREMQEDISHLDFCKANEKITCQKVSIRKDSIEGSETVEKIGEPRGFDYTLPSRRKAESLMKNK